MKHVTCLCLLFLALALVFTGAAQAATVNATFNSASDVPVTAAGYTATGNMVDFTLSYAPTVGTTLTVVKNTNLDFINGTFDNLAQGQAVTRSFDGVNYNFVANYFGGTGNDLVLVWAGTRVVGWGDNRYGQLGNNNTTLGLSPVAVSKEGVLAGKTIIATAAGFHSLALCSDGTVAAWGYNSNGQLGNNSTTNSSVPVLVETAGTPLAGKRVIAIAAGVSHSMVLCSDGTLAAWGSNYNSQLGNNGPMESHVPVAVSTVGTALEGKTVVAFAAGGTHNIALCSDGTLAAWGSNFSGQLGNNGPEGFYLPVAVSTVGTPLEGKTVLAIAAGGLHSIALCSDGTLAAWGDNSNGQLGNNGTVNSSVPIAVTSGGTLLAGKTITAVAAASNHSLALCSDGTIAAWGDNFYGQLGNNSTEDKHVPVAVITAASPLAGKKVVAISAAQLNSLALCSDGTIAAWGSFPLGDNGTANSPVPVPVSTSGLVLGEQFIAAGSGSAAGHSFALVALPLPTVTSVQPNSGITVGGTTVTIKGTEFIDITSVTFGGVPATNIVVSGNGTLTCTSPAGNVGTTSVIVSTLSGSKAANTLFTYLPADLNATYASASDVPMTSDGFAAGEHTLNITLNYPPTTGTQLMVVKNTGLNFISGTFSNLAQGQAVTLSFGGYDYHFVANYFGGTGNDLVLAWAGTRVMDWGSNQFGQLGNKSTTNSAVRVNVDATGVLAGKTVIAVSGGASHNMALCSDGTLAAWGTNYNGEFGNNSNTSSSVPVAVSTAGTALAGKTVIAIAAGEHTSLALCSDGTLAAWGKNNCGQLGNNSTTSSPVPVAVTSNGTPLDGRTAIAIAAGYQYNLALCSDGSLVAWGSNNYGQLGNNSTTNSPVPVAVTTAGTPLEGKNVIAVAAGFGQNLALCSDGTMASWGYNNGAQPSRLPVAVTAAGTPLEGKTVIAVAAGSRHNLVLCSDGTMAAWGSNTFGQLGNNSFTDSTVPVAVATAGTILASKKVITLTAGSAHDLVLCSDGTMVGWGANIVGQLGINSPNFNPEPKPVSTGPLIGGDRIVTVASGSQSSDNLALVAPIVPPPFALSSDGKSIEYDGPASLSNGTDFGPLPLLNSQVTHLFTIANIGSRALHLTGSPPIGITGPAAADFRVTQLPGASVAVGNTTTFAVTFDPTAPGLRTATVTIANDGPSPSDFHFTLAGASILTTKRTQTIRFDAPATFIMGQFDQMLYPQASSGLPVSLAFSGPGAMYSDGWGPSDVGTVRITATQAGDSMYLPAPPVTRTITVKSRPNGLTLFYLNQTYDGQPKPVYAVDVNGNEGIVSYKVGASYVTNAPTAAGTYSVKGVKGSTTVTGTLVVTKAPLLVSLDNKHKFAGQTNPSLTFSYSGFVNGDTSSEIIKSPVPATTATAASPGGVYPITASGGLASNYTFVFGQGSMVVDTFAGAYEALLVDANPRPVGKLSITVAATSKTFTAKLYTAAETTAVSFTGDLVTGNEQATGTATTLVGVAKTPYVINFTLPLYGRVSASATRGEVLLGSAADGQGISTRPLLFAGAHTAVLEPATPASTNVPVGAGWATVAAGSTGMLSFAGRLGDDTVFTASLSPDGLADPGYRLFAQPYVAARTQSYIAGHFNLLLHPSIAKRRYLPQTTLTWNKSGLATDATNRAGFGPVSTVLMIDPWLPNIAATKAAPAITLAQRLGLTGTSFHVAHTATGTLANGNLPTVLNLSATNVVSVLTPLANLTKWKFLTFAPTTGVFTGSFELLDGGTKRTPTFSGVFRQPATDTDALIGDGHYLLSPTTDTEKTTGEVMFSK